ncbi:MAG: PIN domain-containing protein [bacterium]|nr:PIN domain-containing protein [bacterium]
MPLVFIDTDVVISALISSTGAAHLILHENREITAMISQTTLKEILEVSDRLGISTKTVSSLLKKISLKKVRTLRRTSEPLYQKSETPASPVCRQAGPAGRPYPSRLGGTGTGVNRELFENYDEFVYDQNDRHIVASAHQTKSNFLITYNLRHYNKNKIRAKLNIVVVSPGEFLQYLRSR